MVVEKEYLKMIKKAFNLKPYYNINTIFETIKIKKLENIITSNTLSLYSRLLTHYKGKITDNAYNIMKIDISK